MKKVKTVVALSDVAQDLNKGKEFYDLKGPGVGDYFWDSLMADIKSLIIFSGIHVIKMAITGCLQSVSPTPFTIQLIKKSLM